MILPYITLAWGMPGGGEWIIIFVIILLLFGAKRLPELARSLGQAKREFQKGTTEITQEIEKTPPSNGSSSSDPSKKA